MDPTTATDTLNTPENPYSLQARVLDILVFSLLASFCILILFFVVRLCFKFTRRFPHRRGGRDFGEDVEEEDGKGGCVVGEDEKALGEVINRHGVGLSGAGGGQRYSVA